MGSRCVGPVGVYYLVLNSIIARIAARPVTTRTPAAARPWGTEQRASTTCGTGAVTVHPAVRGHRLFFRYRYLCLLQRRFIAYIAAVVRLAFLRSAPLRSLTTSHDDNVAHVWYTRTVTARWARGHWQVLLPSRPHGLF